ncbi:hypothetical protein AX14_010818 [Amanita brunnescens Koide BX004]|nr:hypothetical protein AX14_013418 [Amanita brunnescens Koide BX004]KAF8720649.1 hypothetical protein AX14_010818 [Amanita brunnescens Koide BX004]
MEPLLSPPEAHVIQSFLASIDAAANDWPLYSAGNPDDVQQVPLPHTQGREALAKATKDLMALDADRWQPSFASHYPHRPPRRPHPHQQHPYDFHRQHQQIDHQIGEQHHASISHDPFPFLHPHKHSPYPGLLHQQLMQDASQSVPNTQNLRPLTVPSSRADGHGLHSASPPASTATSSAATTPSTTTSNPIYAFSSTSLTLTEGHPPPQPTSPTSPKQQHAASLSVPQKQNLLSPSQKKANHIQSEQKRRANIRRGYDALCDTVPALREAIREDDEREAEARATGGSKTNGKTACGKSKRGKKEDKADGRAGPRSENVVLSKTIDYIHELLSERQALVNRLHRARDALPFGHPVLIPLTEQPLWEREWTGGEGKYDVKGGGDADEEEEDEESS